MNSMNAKMEYVTSARGLRGRAKDFQSIMTMTVDSFVDFCADPATRYSVTFEMTIKPLPEAPSTSGSHPLTDG